jgi:hypothetical protein
MRRTSITAAQLLHGLLLNTDSFLPYPICSLDSPVYRLRLFYRRSDCFGANRTAADSAAADLILSHAQARREARALRAFTRRGSTKISTGENHEISAFDCSTNHADRRDVDPVQRGRLLRWRHLLSQRLLHDDPIIRVVLNKGPRRETGGASLFVLHGDVMFAFPSLRMTILRKLLD